MGMQEETAPLPVTVLKGQMGLTESIDSEFCAELLFVLYKL